MQPAPLDHSAWLCDCKSKATALHKGGCRRTLQKAAAERLGGGVMGVELKRMDGVFGFGANRDAGVEEFGEDFDAGD
jgi:hypothetical protein